MWIGADYTATTLFSLRLSTATASGARTHLVPTPYTIKMALIDAACRLDGVNIAQANWDWLRGAVVGLRPAERVVVNNTFIKILRPRRKDSKSKEEDVEDSEVGSADAGFFGRTIAYREYAQIDGVFGIALEVQQHEHASLLSRWFPMIQYLGKRGGFVQMISEPTMLDDVSDYLLLDGEPRSFDLEAILTQLDDAGDELTFERANVYSGEKMTLGKHRLFRTVALPYRVARSSRGYTDYQLVHNEDQD